MNFAAATYYKYVYRLRLEKINSSNSLQQLLVGLSLKFHREGPTNKIGIVHFVWFTCF